jgi:glycogen debranching enzyme
MPDISEWPSMPRNATHPVNRIPVHCLASGIVEDSLATRVADRLMQPAMFSGWGIRTFSVPKSCV